jgi:hypothetical protein
MTEELDRPQTVDDLYFDRGNPVAPWRPVMQGDVFRGALVAGLPDDYEFTMITTHPCSMRAGPALKSRLQGVPVRRRSSPVALDQWISGFIRILPLPKLDTSERFHAAQLDEAGIIARDQLRLDRRVATLSDTGILLLQQRVVVNLTRVVLKLATLDDQCRHVLEEAELLEQWNETRAAPLVQGGAQLQTVLDSAARDFDAVLSSPSDRPLRARLLAVEERAGVRKAVRAAMRASPPASPG